MPAATAAHALASLDPTEGARGSSRDQNGADGVSARAAQSSSGDLDALLSRAGEQLEGLQHAVTEASRRIGGGAAATTSGRKARQKAARREAGGGGGAGGQREGKRGGRGRGKGRRGGRRSAAALCDDAGAETWGEPEAVAFEAESDFGSLDSDDSGGAVDATVPRAAPHPAPPAASSSSSSSSSTCDGSDASPSSAEGEASSAGDASEGAGDEELDMYEWTWRYRGRLEAHERQLAASQAAAPAHLHHCLFANCPAAPSSMWLNPGADCVVQRFQGAPSARLQSALVACFFADLTASPRLARRRRASGLQAGRTF